MKRVVCTFGLIAGGLIALMMFITMPFQDRIGFDKGQIIGYTTMILSFLLVFFGIRSYRDNVGDGAIGFGKAFVVGLLITLIASACYVAAWEILYFKFMPDFVDKYAHYSIEKLRASGATSQAIDAQVQEMKSFKVMYNNPLINSAITFTEPLPVGLIITTISAFVLKRKRPTLQADQPAAVSVESA